MKIFGSEITPYATYLNRRKFIKSTIATSIAATFSSQVSAKHEDEKKTYNIEFISYTKTLKEMKLFVNKLTKTYLYEQKNKLGVQKYFFDEKHLKISSLENIILTI